MNNVKRYEKDGKVAVLVSPGFGAGWSSWNPEHAETLCFDVEIVEAILAGDKEKAVEVAVAKCPGIYTGGSRDLLVKWVDKGTRFNIDEYDGSENLIEIGHIEFSEA